MIIKIESLRTGTVAYTEAFYDLVNLGVEIATELLNRAEEFTMDPTRYNLTVQTEKDTIAFIDARETPSEKDVVLSFSEVIDMF